MEQPLTFGGQAVIEGVMMRGPSAMAVAVRRPDGEIVVRSEARPAVDTGRRWLKLPLVRGVAGLGESAVLGIRALIYSAEQSLGEGEEVSRGQMNAALAVAGLFAIGLFFVLPTALAALLRPALPSPLTLNVAEGALRVAILLGYLGAVSRLDDMRRVLAYHGAEHKAIHTIEAGQALTVENARVQSRLHPRCGTSFLLFVVLVSVVLFAFFGWPVLWKRILVRVLLLPVLAGLGYEVLRASARWNRRSSWQGLLAGLVVAPGLWLQRLTTREPDEAQLEVALRALESVRPAAPLGVV